MRVIIGYGNTLRGEDGFGVDVIEELQKHNLKGTKLISCFQLTPELSLELLEAQEIIFIDACFSLSNNYALACSIDEKRNNTNLSHHISPKIIIDILDSVYSKKPKFLIYSMLTNSFDRIDDLSIYNKRVIEISELLANLSNSLSNIKRKI